jgi:hypothetical membrane protein
LGFLRPGYSLVSEQISELGVGENAPVMNASFVIMGLLIIVSVIGIFQNMKELSGWIVFRRAIVYLKIFKYSLTGIFQLVYI